MLFSACGHTFTQSEVIVTWLVQLGEIHDAQPDKNEIHLPYGKKRQVYNLYLEDLKVHDDLLFIKESKFVDIWNKHCPHIKVRAYHR